MWVSPVVTLLITYLMWADAGWAGIIGIMTVFVVVPIQGKCKQFMKYLTKKSFVPMYYPLCSLIYFRNIYNYYEQILFT